VKKQIQFADFIKRLEKFLKEPGKLKELLQAVSDGTVDIDSQTKSFLTENRRALRILNGDMGCVDPGDMAEAAFGLILYQDGQEFAAVDYPIKDGSVEIRRITPAVYSLKTVTGLLLWQKRLKQQNLLISKSSQKDGRFKMAADSGQDKPVALLAEELANGAMTLNVYAGFEAGRIEIVAKSIGDSNDER